MAESFYTILTAIGKAKIANAYIQGTSVGITKLAIGDGNGAYYNPVDTQTKLKKEVWRGNINTIKVDVTNPNWIVIEAVVPATDGGFTVREAGIFDTVGDMIAIGKYPETYKPVLADGSSKDLYIKMIIEVSNSSAVELKVDPSVAIATKKDIEEVNNSISNVSTRIGTEESNSSAVIRETIPSGFTKLGDIDYTYGKANPNKLKIGASTAFVNGWKIDIADGTIIEVGSPPTIGEREDLVFLEVWKEKISDTAGEKINSRIRVVPGVDFNKSPEGVSIASGYTGGSNPPSVVMVQGGNTSPLIWDGAKATSIQMFYDFNYRTLFNHSSKALFINDTGICVTGDGTTTAKNLLKTADGYVYAIPMFRVKRRNSGGYSVVNPNGATNYEIGFFEDITTTGLGTDAVKQVTAVVDKYDSINVGDVFVHNTSTTYFMIVLSKDGNNKVTIRNLGASGLISISKTYKSKRSDKLLANVIDERDILDLRHQVSLTGFDYQSLMEDNFDRLLRGDLQTKEKKKMLKTYHGIPKTPIDANTVFYASFDGTTVAEVGGGSNLTTGQFKPSLTGRAYKNSNSEVCTPFELPNFSKDEGSIDIVLDSEELRAATVHVLGIKNAVSNVFDLYYRASDTSLIFQIFQGDGTSTNNKPITQNIAQYKGLIHCRVTWSKLNNKMCMYINGVLLNSTTFNVTINGSNSDFKLVPFANVSYSTGAAAGNVVTIADLAVSNIDRGANFATLPADFIAGYARIDKAFNGQRKTYSDALTSQYTVGIAKYSGTGHSKGVTMTKTGANWGSGDTIKVKGLAGEIISGVIDTDTALARVMDVALNNSITIVLDDVSKLAVGDTVKLYSMAANIGYDRTVQSIDSNTKTVTFNIASTFSDGYNYVIIETTASTSSPLAKFMNAGTLTTINGTWTGLGTNEATFTLGTNASLTNADIQVEYSLNMVAGQGGVPEVYSTTLAGEYKGKKLVLGTIAVRDDLKGKIKADSSPMTVKTAKSTSLQAPATFITEIETADYNNIATQGDGLAYSLSTSLNGEIPQALISIDVIKEIEAKYGIIPSIDKVNWIKNNVNKISINLNAYGINSSGNKINLAVYEISTDGYALTSTHTLNTSSLISVVVGSFTNRLNTDGFINFIVYTDASNGTMASSITIDSINVEIELRGITGYDMLVPENARRDDGLSNVLLVRKETKEIQAYFDCTNTDGVITYGDYVPYQGQDSVSTKILALYNKMVATTIGTGLAGSDYLLPSTVNVNYNNLYSKLVNDKLDYQLSNEILDSINAKAIKYMPIDGMQIADNVSRGVGGTTGGLPYCYSTVDLGYKNILLVVIGLVNINSQLFLRIAAKVVSGKSIKMYGGQYKDFALNGKPLIKG